MQLINENGVRVGLRCILTVRIQTVHGTRAQCQLQEALTLWQLLSSHSSFLPSSPTPAGSSSCVWINSPISMYWNHDSSKGHGDGERSLSLSETVSLWAGRTACVHFRKNKSLLRMWPRITTNPFFCPSLFLHVGALCTGKEGKEMTFHQWRHHNIGWYLYCDGFRIWQKVP